MQALLADHVWSLEEIIDLLKYPPPTRCEIKDHYRPDVP
jgi:hypothetical protein